MTYAIYVRLSFVLTVCAIVSDMNKSSYKVALGGVIAALCLLGMFLTGVIPFLNMTLPMIAGALITVIAVEVNSPWAVMTYIAVSFLSIFITFDKTFSGGGMLDCEEAYSAFVEKDQCDAINDVAMFLISVNENCHLP